MGTPLDDTWHRREHPVLVEIARALDNQVRVAGVRYQALTERTDLTVDDVARAVRALASAGLVTKHHTSSDLPRSVVTEISPEARRLVGLWPTPETALDRMIRALEVIAENSDDEDTRTNAQRTADWFRRSLNTVGLTVASAAITGQL